MVCHHGPAGPRGSGAVHLRGWRNEDLEADLTLLGMRTARAPVEVVGAGRHALLPSVASIAIAEAMVEARRMRWIDVFRVASASSTIGNTSTTVP